MLRVPKDVYAEMRRHGEETYPEECCGVLLGKKNDGERVVQLLVRCQNGGASTRDRYIISPEELISAQKLGREHGLDVVGFYHSHPDCAARWSVHDLNEAHWFACSYVIVSVEGGLATRTNSFVLCGTSDDDKRFDDEIVELV